MRAPDSLRRLAEVFRPKHDIALSTTCKNSPRHFLNPAHVISQSDQQCIAAQAVHAAKVFKDFAGDDASLSMTIDVCRKDDVFAALSDCGWVKKINLHRSDLLEFTWIVA